MTLIHPVPHYLHKGHPIFVFKTDPILFFKDLVYLPLATLWEREIMTESNYIFLTNQ